MLDMQIIRVLRKTIAFGIVAAALPMPAADKPVVIAHRGGAALRPENTIAAFQHALKLGVTVIEFDMNVTSDGVVVIHHDSTVNAHVCRPPAGSSLKPGPIALLKLAEIQQFDCGSFARPDSPHYQPVPGARMPTLDEFLSSMKGSRATLLGETKMPPRGTTASASPEQFIDLVHAAIKRHGVEDRFILQSGDYQTIDAMWKKNPKIRLCLLNARRFKPAYLDIARRHHATHLMLRTDDIDAAGVKQLQQSGLTLYSSTANIEADWRKYVELKMDGILTDDPRGLLDFLKQASPAR